MFLLLCLQVAYGTTENSPVTFMGFPDDSITRKTETVGCIFPHTEVTVTLPACSRPQCPPCLVLALGHAIMFGSDIPY